MKGYELIKYTTFRFNSSCCRTFFEFAFVGVEKSFLVFHIHERWHQVEVCGKAFES